jgi:hypothetical protein
MRFIFTNKIPSAHKTTYGRLSTVFINIRVKSNIPTSLPIIIIFRLVMTWLELFSEQSIEDLWLSAKLNALLLYSSKTLHHINESFFETLLNFSFNTVSMITFFCLKINLNFNQKWISLTIFSLQIFPVFLFLWMIEKWIIELNYINTA